MPIDWSIAQPRNIFADYVGGAKVGQEMGERKRKREALNLFSTDPEGAIKALTAAGDIDTANALRTNMREDRKDKARTTAVEQYQGGKAGEARQTAIGAGDFELASQLASLDKEQREVVKARAEAMSRFGPAALKKPYEQRRAFIQAQAAYLKAHGYTDQEIAEVDPTDEFFTGSVASAQTVNEQLKADLEREKFGETRRHNQVGEKNDSARVGISRGQLGVAQSNSARGWAAHNARLKGVGGYGTPGVGGVIADDDVEIDH